jgi:hypothetical protein
LSRIIFALKTNSEKKKNLSYRAEPEGLTRSNSAQPPGPPEPIWARRYWPWPGRPGAAAAELPWCALQGILVPRAYLRRGRASMRALAPPPPPAQRAAADPRRPPNSAAAA